MSTVYEVQIYNGDCYVIRPVLIEVVVTQRDGNPPKLPNGEYTPSYSLVIDGRHQCGGFASHLGSNSLPTGISFLDIGHKECANYGDEQCEADSYSPLAFCSHCEEASVIALDRAFENISNRLRNNNQTNNGGK